MLSFMYSMNGLAGIFVIPCLYVESRGIADSLLVDGVCPDIYSRVWFQSTDCIFKLPVKSTMLFVDIRDAGQRPAESIFDDRPVWIDD